MLRDLVSLSLRELSHWRHNPMYALCMVVFPALMTWLFTTLLAAGQPTSIPVGVVDEDQSSTTRRITRLLDTFQDARVVAHFATIDEARAAMQRNEVYGFMHFPRHFAADVLAQRQPSVAIYYNYAFFTAGALAYREMKTTALLATGAVGQTTMQARGVDAEHIRAFLQPIVADFHPVGNPWINYNYYLSPIFVPCCIVLLIFLLTAYALGMELKCGTSKEWLAAAGGRITVALVGKLLPYTLVFLLVLGGVQWWLGVQGFPHNGGVGSICLLTVLTVLAAQGFGVFAFGLAPSLRMSMSLCSLWGVLNFSMNGVAFPVFAMHPALQTLALLFPMRHYFLFYQTVVFGGAPLAEALPILAAFAAFILLPTVVLWRVKRAAATYEYLD